MARGFSTTLVNTWLDAQFATAWIKLHVGDPGASGANNAAAGDTSRKQATMASASGGSKSASAPVGPWANVSTTETVSDISDWTASSAGTFQASGQLTVSQPWVNTNTLTLTSLTFSVSGLAA